MEFIVSHMSLLYYSSLLSNCTFDTTSNIFNNIVNVNQYVGVHIRRRIAMTYDNLVYAHHAKCPSPHANLSDDFA